MSLKKWVGTKLSGSDYNNNLDHLDKPDIKENGEDITFERGAIHAKEDPETGNLTIDPSGAIPGKSVVVYINRDTNPAFVGASVSLNNEITVSGTYKLLLLNVGIEGDPEFIGSIFGASSSSGGGGGEVTAPQNFTAVVQGSTAPQNFTAVAQ